MEAPPLISLSPVPTVALIFESDEVHTGWAIISSTAAEVTAVRGVDVGRANLGFRQRLTLQAVEVGMKLSAQSQQVVDLLVYSRSARNELLSLGEMFGLVQVARGDAIDFEHETFLRVVDELAADVKETTGPVVPAPLAPRIVAATDGGYHENYGGGSYGWISADGRFSFGQAHQSSSALASELHALLHLLRRTHAGTRLTVLVDSRSAINAVDLNGCVQHLSHLTSHCQRLVDLIVWQREHRVDFVLEWVKGHVGHPLNDAADRLARLARQSKVFGTPTPAVDLIAKRIATDALIASPQSNVRVAIAA
jgi:ribonuclease HI